MSKFKIGDKIKITHSTDWYTAGDRGVIIDVPHNDKFKTYDVTFGEKGEWYVSVDNMRLDISQLFEEDV